MRIQRIVGADIIPKIKDLRKMTVSSSSYMNRVMTRMENEALIRDRTTAFLAIEKKNHLGWAMLLHPNDCDVQLMVYVNPIHRQHGLATKLVNKALQHSVRPVVRIWDQQSSIFWNKFKDKVTLSGGIWYQ